ncbi:DUF4199 domain-containing protein [Pontibacter chitinilyticus]|uniref:DUF4199 domain-containing protein n=1 Tax=Pontibacter chitinilyticus TaxID=2674989 RepID=UPI003219E290
MAVKKVSYQKVSIKYGIYTGLAHIVYFLFMRVFGLLDVTELSFLSGLFLVVGICLAINNFKKVSNGVINYFQGLAIGAITGVVSSTILAFFLLFYISFFDATYLNNLQASAFFPQSLSMLSLFVLTIIYGSWPGFWLAYIAMQWFKNPDHTMSEQIR